jgi:hypothetical protein
MTTIMTPRERLLTTLKHKEPDRVPLTAKLWPDTLLKLRRHYRVSTNDELFERMGVDSGAVNVAALPAGSWRPSAEYASFCRTIGYDPYSQYATYEEWGIQNSREADRQVLLLITGSLHKAKTSYVDVTLSTWHRMDASTMLKTIVEKKDLHVIIGGLGHVLWIRPELRRGNHEGPPHRPRYSPYDPQQAPDYNHDSWIASSQLRWHQVPKTGNNYSHSSAPFCGGGIAQVQDAFRPGKQGASILHSNKHRPHSPTLWRSALTA